MSILRNSILFTFALIFISLKLDFKEVQTLRINFVIIQKDDGSGNFDTSNILHKAYLKRSVENLNNSYSFTKRKLRDSICLKKSILTDSYVRFRHHRTLIIKNDSLWNNDNDKNPWGCPDRRKWYYLGLQKHLDSIIPDEDKGINIYLTVSNCHYNELILKKDSCPGDFSQAACSMFPSSDTSAFSVIHYPNAFLKYTIMQDYPYQWGVSTFGKGLAHELGHSLGLVHRRSCSNIMNGKGSTDRNNLEDDQINLIHQKIASTNLIKYLDKRLQN